MFDELEENAAIFAGFRYSYRGAVPKNFTWYDEALPNLDDQRFRMMLRCSRQQFNVILALIENHPVFHGFNSNKQFSVQFQLALALYRLGSYGEGATLGKIASLFGVGDGGTIAKITTRVFESILSLEKEFLKWPSDEERKQLVLETFDELPHCIGYVDDTEVALQERPVWHMDPESYFSKEKQYSIKLQAVGDYALRFRQILVGYPGSVHDARIYNNCMLATQPKDYFTEPQYLAADCAFQLTTTVITPFRQNSTALTPRKRTRFNRMLSSKRVRIEHCFGVMKEKLASLKCLSVKIKDEKSHKFACTWIRVCCILHNILLPHYDEEDFACTHDANFGIVVEEGECMDENEKEGEAKQIALSEILAEQSN